MILTTLSQFISPFHQLLIGFSGGLDSTVLLYHLVLLRDQQPGLKLRAIHVHHGLSPNADKWVMHCLAVCSSLKIPLIVKHVSLKEKGGLGTEGEARKARYSAFSNALFPKEALITGHHLDDQFETLLLALKRGSGPVGLSGMSMRTYFYGTEQLRPFLNIQRSSLLSWANKYKLHWIEDESNHNDNFDRNFLRLQIVPLLVRRWPFFPISAARSAQLCAEQEKLLDELLCSQLSAAISKEGAIKIASLQNKSSAHRGALLRRWLSAYQALMPSREMLIRIWHEVALARPDANPALHLDGGEIRRYQGKLWWIKRLPPVEDYKLFWSNPEKEPLVLPHRMGEVFLHPGGKIRFPLKREKVTVRFQARGVLHIVGRAGGRKIKKIWQEYKVPPWRRRAIPLLFYDETLIAAAGLFITREGFSKAGVKFTWNWK